MSMSILDKDEWEDLVERVEELEKATYENESGDDSLNEDEEADGEEEKLKKILWSGEFSLITYSNSSFFISFLYLMKGISPLIQTSSSYSI